MATKGRDRSRFEKLYTSVPLPVKKALQAKAERGGPQVAVVVRELLMERYANPRHRDDGERASQR